MKLLLNKEIRLTASPLTWFFLLFSAMTMLPGYPILVGAFFICLGIFYSFQFGREFNDTLYTALLPVEKKDVVRAKFAFSVLIELLALALMSVLTALRMALLQSAAPYTANPMMNANLAYLGYALIVFALFNALFLPGFFKTAYVIGRPFIAFCVVSFLAIALAETLHHLPGLAALNSTGAEALQLPVLLCGAALYPLLTLFSLRRSERRFENVDL